MLSRTLTLSSITPKGYNRQQLRMTLSVGYGVTVPVWFATIWHEVSSLSLQMYHLQLLSPRKQKMLQPPNPMELLTEIEDQLKVGLVKILETEPELPSQEQTDLAVILSTIGTDGIFEPTFIPNFPAGADRLSMLRDALETKQAVAYVLMFQATMTGLARHCIVVVKGVKGRPHEHSIYLLSNQLEKDRLVRYERVPSPGELSFGASTHAFENVFPK